MVKRLAKRAVERAVGRASSAFDTGATNAQDGRFTSLFFAGDIGQRIIRYSFPWKPFGIDLRGKSRGLKVNYRTTRQIRSMADRLMEEKSEDADGIVQERKGTVSLLSGPDPEFRQFDTVDDEIEGVAEAEVIAGLQDIYDTERNLLYVACTRARDYLLVTSAGIPSELLLDIYPENRNCNF